MCDYQDIYSQGKHRKKEMKLILFCFFLLAILFYGSINFLSCGDDIRNGGFYNTCTLGNILRSE